MSNNNFGTAFVKLGLESMVADTWKAGGMALQLDDFADTLDLLAKFADGLGTDVAFSWDDEQSQTVWDAKGALGSELASLEERAAELRNDLRRLRTAVLAADVFVNV